MAEPLPSEHTLPDVGDEYEKLGKWLSESTTKFECKQGMNECVDACLNTKITPLFRKLVCLIAFSICFLSTKFFRASKETQTTGYSILIRIFSFDFQRSVILTIQLLSERKKISTEQFHIR